MAKPDYPNTLAVRFLKTRTITFIPHLYRYEEHGGTRHAAEMLHVPEHAVIKTLVMETDSHDPLLVLMHGNCEVSTKQLARLLGIKRVSPCGAALAHKYTGYQVGGISPFGTRMQLPVWVESTILALDKIYINGGKRGFLVEIDPQDLQKALSVKKVEVAIQL
jgi:Cys-tRNA(Pro) deacylase